MADPSSRNTEKIAAWSSAIVAVLTLGFSIFQTRLQLKDLSEETAKQIAELRNEDKVKHLVDEDDHFERDAMRKARRALAVKRIDSAHEKLRPLDLDNPPDEMSDILDFCDHVGLLTHRGYLDPQDVWSEMSYWLFPIYTDAIPVLESERGKRPAQWRECAWLIETLRPIEDKEDKGADTHPTPEDIYEFYDGER